MSIFWFFDQVFANTGDTTAIPDPTQGDGSVSFNQGYGPDYQADPSDPDVLYPERPKMNWLFKAITSALQQWQVHAFPDFIAASDNGGSPYPYDQWAFVRYSGSIYYSLVNANTALPTDTTKWSAYGQQQIFSTGMTMIHEDVTVPSGGWVWTNGQTIGDASSNATGRANADTVNLFTQIWTAFPNGVRPILNSDGSAGVRGVSAAADYAAHKALPLRDLRCVVPAGTATMGGTSNRGLLTGYRQGVDASVFGATGGEQSHVPITAEMAAHTHTVPVEYNPPDSTIDQAGPDSKFVGLGTTTTSSTGSGQNFNVVQPTTICNWITKL